MAARAARSGSLLPRRGCALVTVVVVDENGFSHQYERIEAPIGAVRETLAALHLQSTALAAPAMGQDTA
ncbi:hypothetical protein NQ152_12940 [Microbacterium sp. zg.B48]|uniref:hypothetical protein n=1 Tax=unclassified Microbacterium TaxID=2609290 RepID=UPI00214B56C6|nr:MULTISPECIES: hypothetical protein [unclassified Microbacterium]MCR2764411.1 hypothetical protein [Microbacterium sp. zg.B48]MCR2810986.1 hypothetical protein [Microbacterium sp. zg.B185]WIM19616.1 hypothetical protein QNO12_02070 [Microbacterium sp. zg-B185]